MCESINAGLWLFFSCLMWQNLGRTCSDGNVTKLIPEVFEFGFV